MGFTIEIYAIGDAAKDLGIGKETLRKWARDASLTLRKAGNVELITGDELDMLSISEMGHFLNRTLCA
jgi:phage antirepressor YoqD-like protein